jgi:beta-glucuronidase
MNNLLKLKLMNFKAIIVAFSLLFSTALFSQEFTRSNPKDIALYPQLNDSRGLRNLSGLWNFKKDPGHKGIDEKWFNSLSDYKQIAVPGNWNEQFTDMMRYNDWAWYETYTFIPSSWKGNRIGIRIGEASSGALVWINGKPLGQHEGGHVPFAFDISALVNWDGNNRITIRVENLDKPERLANKALNMRALGNNDYFTFSGINRDVWIYSLPSEAYIQDITVTPSFTGATGELKVFVEQKGDISIGKVIVSGDKKRIEQPLSFKNGKAMASIKIPDVRLWSLADPFLYNITVVLGTESKAIDTYSLETGVRTVAVDNKRILLNGKAVVLKGFDTNEDFPVYGGGTCGPVLVNDFELLKWTGANAVRTSFYPFNEEYYEMADKNGILVIEDSPAMGMFRNSDVAEMKKFEVQYTQYLEEMILRDKNHPSVIMWNLAVEPTPKPNQVSTDESKTAAHGMFSNYIKKARSLDPTRLIMYMGINNGPSEWFDLVDVIAISRFQGWYYNLGKFDEGISKVSEELDKLHKQYNKPCMIAEFGGAAISGINAVNPEMFSEEYQLDLLKGYLAMADSKEYVPGMFISGFTDFRANQSIIRLGELNLKGVFTRERRPKMAAHYLRSQWTAKKQQTESSGKAGN